MITITLAILTHMAALVMTGICLGIGFLIVRMIEDWIQGKRIMANQQLMEAIAKA